MHPLVTIYSQAGNVLFPVWEHCVPKLGIKQHNSQGELMDLSKKEQTDANNEDDGSQNGAPSNLFMEKPIRGNSAHLK